MGCPKRALNSDLDAKLYMARIELNVKGHRKMANRELPARFYRCPRCGKHHLTKRK